MKKVTVGNVKFEKPIVEKVVDIHYILEEEGKDIVRHKYFILSYEDFDKPLTELVKELDSDSLRFIVANETISINFGDEEIQKHKDTVIEYDEEWIKKYHPDEKDFHTWLLEFADEIVFSKKIPCKV